MKNTGTRAVLLMILTGMLYMPARGNDLTRRVGIGLDGGVDLPVRSEYLTKTFDPDMAWGFWARTGLSERWGVGISYDNLHFKNSPLHIQPQMVNAFYQLGPKSRWNPNVHAGLGMMTFVKFTESFRKSSFAATAGAGADFFASPLVSVGLSVDYYLASMSSIHNDFQVLAASLKLGFWVGGPKNKPQPIAEKPAAPAPAPVVAPAPEPVAAPAPAPVPAPVAAPEPPPAPVAPAPVLSTDTKDSGAEAPKADWVLNSVNFELNSAVLTADGRKQLDEIVTALKARDTVRMEIHGHTDSTGADDYNLQLSEQRAAAAKAYLVDQGIAADRLTSISHGDTMPIADNSTHEGREANRRIEFKILDK